MNLYVLGPAADTYYLSPKQYYSQLRTPSESDILPSLLAHYAVTQFNRDNGQAHDILIASYVNRSSYPASNTLFTHSVSGC